MFQTLVQVAILNEIHVAHLRIHTASIGHEFQDRKLFRFLVSGLGIILQFITFEIFMQSNVSKLQSSSMCVWMIHTNIFHQFGQIRFRFRILHGPCHRFALAIHAIAANISALLWIDFRDCLQHFIDSYLAY